MINITTATQNAAIAFDTYSKLTASKRAEFLETIANNIEALGEQGNQSTIASINWRKRPYLLSIKNVCNYVA
jgi:acyl-CoA reductase-like NAD-dependent aldehyde dehydrogenase